MNNIIKIKNCVCCNSNNLDLLLDLNDQPLANSYSDKKVEFEKYPLQLNVCMDCFHLQLKHQVNLDLMFKDYLYVSGTSNTMRDYFQWFAKFVNEQFYGQPCSVLDIGCNDGSLLDVFKSMGYDTFGVDPAENLFHETSKRHTIKCDYFKDGIFDRKFDVLVAQNVFAHGSNPLEFLNNCSNMMSNDSLLFVQTSQANLVLNNEFDSIYHEHFSFFNINSIVELLKRTDLHLIDVIKTSIHGISYLFIISKLPKNQQKINMLIEVERLQGLYSKNTYQKYRDNIEKLIKDFRKIVSDFRSNNFQIVGYGAAAKGMTFLNFSNVELDYIIDDNPLKQGKYTSNGILVTSCDEMGLVPDDVGILFIPLAWNYFDEIYTKIKKVRNNKNDKFIKYFPEVTII